jgi:hypothetical protein
MTVCFVTEITAKTLGHWSQFCKDNVVKMTQTGIRHIFLPSERKVCKKAPWISYPLIKSDFYTDQMFSKIKDVHNHNGGSVFPNDLAMIDFIHCNPKVNT